MLRDFAQQLDQLRRLHEDLELAETLTAVVLVRAGTSWDVLASRGGVSRQALHRRLARRGEDAFALTNKHGWSDDIEFDLALLKSYSRAGMLNRLRDSPQRPAPALTELRRRPRWWANGGRT